MLCGTKKTKPKTQTPPKGARETQRSTCVKEKAGDIIIVIIDVIIDVA